MKLCSLKKKKECRVTLKNHDSLKVWQQLGGHRMYLMWPLHTSLGIINMELMNQEKDNKKRSPTVSRSSKH